MRYRATVTACGLVLVFVGLSNVAADPESCREAIERYNSAKSDVLDALRLYTNCVRDSAGKDDCSSEFDQLSSEQDDFESAVSAYNSECS